MVFINRGCATIACPDPIEKIIKGRDFWTFRRAREAMAHANKEKDRIISLAKTAYEEEKKRGYNDGVEFAKLEQSQNMIAIVSQTVDYFSSVESQMV
jgi:type III secretion protein L